MRKMRLTATAILLVMGLTGCSSSNGKGPGTTNPVDKVLQQQTSQTDDGSSSDVQISTNPSSNPYLGQEDLLDAQMSTTEGVDYDLTKMSSDMVYAMVYQLMTDPDNYIGKTIRIDGNYYASYYENTGLYYHFVVIADAAACCSQGIEFTWGDGSHVYPDEYPADETEVQVTGVFETYREEGDSNLYCRLKDATMEVVK